MPRLMPRDAGRACNGGQALPDLADSVVRLVSGYPESLTSDVSLDLARHPSRSSRNHPISFPRQVVEAWV